MPKQKTKPEWQITVESVYVFGREERLEAAYEQIVPSETIQVKNKEVKDGGDKSRALRKSFE